MSMPGELSAAELLALAAVEREKAASAHRLAENVNDRTASRGLTQFAEELESHAADLEARAAVMKQSAQETNAEPEQDIAALRPPAEPAKDA
jgi:hypothetical protein